MKPWIKAALVVVLVLAGWLLWFAWVGAITGCGHQQLPAVAVEVTKLTEDMADAVCEEAAGLCEHDPPGAPCPPLESCQRARREVLKRLKARLEELLRQ